MYVAPFLLHPEIISPQRLRPQRRDLDALVRCDTVAFDKTGTLTTGELRCTSIQLLHGFDPEEAAAGSPVHGVALAVAAALEQVGCLGRA